MLSGTAHHEAQILIVLAEQVDAWNEGSLEGYMAGYLQSDSLRFISGNNIRLGWSEALEAYRRTYQDRDTMGTLAFSDVEVRLLSDDWALVFGRWTLTREAGAPTGLFSLIFERRPEGWRIVHDHTSS